jgi:hypothetical protein
MLRGRLAGWSDPRLIASALAVVMIVLYIVLK